jgi:predicted DNA binding CopG/RHH family protein
MSEQKTTIRVAESTKERLKNRGEMGMSYDDALNHVLDQLEELEDREDNE